ncbi:MAG: GNAT family N-acetyltransferase [Chloroflexota bacterium]|nr:GNAT family N-acetyltransferase [Chloroflexota bacterium]
MTNELAAATYIGDLGDGLVCRWSTLADQAKIGHLMSMVWRDSPDDPPNPRAPDRARITMSEDYPFMGPGDFAIVEDRGKPECPVIACTCFWRHEWSYAGIKFGVGRPEYVATDATYRNRGLVRTLFAMIHARSAAEGHLAQAITGIPYFYRQFDYDFVLDLEGRRITYLALVPVKKGDDPEPYSLRLATLDDVAHLVALYNQGRRTSLVWHEADEAFWHYTISCWDAVSLHGEIPATSALNMRLYIITDSAGSVCGYTQLEGRRWGRALGVYDLQLYPHVNWGAAMPSLLRLLRDQALQTPTVKPDAEPVSEISFNLGRAHPIYAVLGDELAPRFEPPYAWYLRVPDVPAFVRLITPVLEARLTNSVLTGYTGELKFDFYRGGLRLQIEAGKIALVEPWRAPAYGDNANAGCPPLTFLQLLFGYRSLAALRAIYPDVWANAEVTLLIDTLFPAQPSAVHPLG